MSAARELKFNTEDDALSEVARLRRGYRQHGNWTLPQVCWHLNVSVQMRMKPGPHPPTTPEQAARAGELKQALASGKLPAGLVAPPQMTPPADAGDEAIDGFIQTLQTFRDFRGETAPHRLFGRLTDADARRLNLIHCAHHLSHLSPTD